MSYAVKILADSIHGGVRLVTFEATFPRFILAEVNTHRVLSRNSASSRAIPVERRIAQVRQSPFVPESFSKNQKGMQAAEDLADLEGEQARLSWLRAMEACATEADYQRALGVHKQYANRLIECFGWHTAVISATHWANFFALRTHKGAQPEMQIIAKMMKAAYDASAPRELKVYEWHLPYVEDYDPAASDYVVMPQVRRSVVCCAAVSFERQLAERTEEQILGRHDDMVKNGHWSPFEHQALVATEAQILHYAHHRWDVTLERFVPDTIGNFSSPWLQYRKLFKGEDVFQPEGEKT